MLYYILDHPIFQKEIVSTPLPQLQVFVFFKQHIMVIFETINGRISFEFPNGIFGKFDKDLGNFEIESIYFHREFTEEEIDKYETYVLASYLAKHN